MVFFAVVNHWIPIIIEKNEHAQQTFYMLDSENFQHLNRHEDDLTAITQEAFVWKKLRLGIKPIIRFLCQMSIQSLYDQRNFYYKIARIFNPDD